MTIFCELEQTLAARLVPTLRGQVRTVATLPELAIALVQEPTENVVVIGSTVDLEPALSLSARLRDERPGARIIVLRERLDAEIAARATAAGVHEIIPCRDTGRIIEALARAQSPDLVASDIAMAIEPRERPYGRIITVFSAKGGCGKTTIATNLGIALHHGGANRVCIVDLDLSFGDVAISLSLAPRRTLVDALDLVGILEAHIDEVLTQFHPGLDCVLAPVKPGDGERIPPSLVAELLVGLSSRYDYVVIDTPSQLSEHVLEALDVSDHHVLLATPDLPALTNLRRSLDMLDLLSYAPEARSIVLNRADARGGLTVTDAAQTVRSPIAALVPASHDVPASINNGVPIVEASPNHAVSKAITEFAARALARDLVVGAAPARSRRLRLRKRSA